MRVFYLERGEPLIHTLFHISEAATTRSRIGLLCPTGQGSPVSKEPLVGFGMNLSGPPEFYLWFVMLCRHQWHDVGRVQTLEKQTKPKSLDRASSTRCPRVFLQRSDNIGFEGGQESSKSSLSEGKQRSFQSCFGKGTRRGEHPSGGNWREEDVGTGTTRMMQRPA